MSENAGVAGVQGVFGALLGGMIASFVWIGLFTVLGIGGGSAAATWVAAAGMGSAIVLMIAGMAAAEAMPWLAISLLFASGFTTMGTLVFGFSQPWVALPALGVGIAIGMTVGVRRFGHAAKPTVPIAVEESVS